MKRNLRTILAIGTLVLFIGLAAGCRLGATPGEPEESFGGRIIGIEPGAGVMAAAERAIEEYDLQFELQDSSSFAMAAALQTAIENSDWIVVTGWSPHWKFTKYDLKFLEDPKGVFGEVETLNTIVRQGLEEDDPALYAFMDNFSWGPDDMGAVMLDISGGMDPAEAGRKWVDENEDKVAAWSKGLEFEDPGTVRLVYVEWECAIASTHVMQAALEDLGYDVELTSVDAGIMWQGMANGNFDATTAAWLPVTHRAYYEEVQDEVVDLGPNFEGEARIGLVVPEYVTIDSITEMNDHR